MANTLQMMINLDVAMNNGWVSDFRGLEAGFERLKKAGSDLQTQTGKISEYQKMQGALSSSKNSLETLRNQMSRNSVSLQESREKTSRLSTEYENAKKRLAALSQTYKPNNILVQTAKQHVKELEQQYKTSSQETKRLEENQSKLYRAIGQGEAKIEEETRSLEGMKKSLSEAGINTQQLAANQEKLAAASQRLNKAQNKLASIKEQLSWSNIKGDLLASAGAVMAFKQPIVIDMEFEQAMANVRAVMAPTIEEFNALREQSIELGRSTQFSASQAAASQENLARAGFTTQQILDTMPGLLSMSAAEGMDLAQAATILAGGLRGMNLDMSQTMRLADAFAYTSAHSATNITNLGEAFKAVAATASLQGASPEQLLSYLGTLANLQVEAGEAGNAIKSAFMRLSNPAKEAQNVLSRFGIQVVKNGRMRELGNLLEELYTKTEKLGAAEQLKAFSIIFGKNYGDSLIKLARGVMSGEQKELLRGLNNDKTGASDMMAGMRNDTLKGDLTALSSAWEGLNIAIGNALEPINRFFTQTLTTGIQKFTEFINNNKTLCEWAVRIAYAFAGWKILSTAYKYGSLLVQLPFAKLNVILAESAAKAALTGNSFSVMGTLMNTLMHPLTALKSAFSLLWGVIAAHPFMAIIAVVSALIYYWDDLKKLWEVSLNWLGEKWEWLKEFWSNLSFPDLFAELSERLSVFGEYFSHKWDEFKSWINLPDIFTELKTRLSVFGEYFSHKWNEFKSWINLPDVFATLRERLSVFGEYFSHKWNEFRSWLNLPDVFATLRERLSVFGNYFSQKWDEFKSWINLPDIFTELKTRLSVFGEYFSHKWEEFKSWINLPDVFATLRERLSVFGEYFSHKWDEFKSWLVLPDIFAPMKEFFDSVVNYIRDKWQGVIDWFKSLNPFSSWSAPAAPSVNVGGVSHSTGGSKQVENALRAINGMASGGLVKEHSIIQVAERGPEVIIPLREKSRGLEMLSLASEKLGITPHAKGGFFSRPHIGLVGEAGPEAIIPLSDKSRGLSMLFQTADMLGVLPQNSNSSQKFESLSNALSEVIFDNGRRYSSFLDNPNSYTRNAYAPDMVSRPPLTFNINVSGENEELAEKIAQTVRNVLDNLSEYEERVDYA